MGRFEGMTAVVTGGATGLGLGIGRALAQRGANIVVAGPENDELAAAVNDLESLGVEVMGVPTDVGDVESVQRLAELVDERFGSVQVVVNNAGVVQQKDAWSMSAEEWRWLLRVNLDGPINGTIAFLPRMVSQDGERFFVIVSSVAGLGHRVRGLASYRTSKFASLGLAEALRDDLEGTGVQVSVVCPGPLDTLISTRSRPPGLPETATHALGAGREEIMKWKEARGNMDPDTAGELVVGGMERGDFYILTHPNVADEINERHSAIEQALVAEAARR